MWLDFIDAVCTTHKDELLSKIASWSRQLKAIIIIIIIELFEINSDWNCILISYTSIIFFKEKKYRSTLFSKKL